VSARRLRRRPSLLTLRALLPFAVAGAALLAAGCAGRAVDSSAADANAGKTLFSQNCGGCHTLADAGTMGKVGQNLDDAFRAARSEKGGSFEESTIFDVTLDQMKLAASPMPRFDTGPQKLSEEELRNIAAYVASTAGVPPQQADGATGATGAAGATGTSTTP
jgi:mono/diheme cytochrome c family protein